MKYFGISWMVLGVLLFSVGLLFKAMELDDLWRGIITGPIIFGIGVVLLLVHLSKNRKS
jgi:hypothetical protein